MKPPIQSMKRCPVDVVMGMIGGKWKSAILWHLMREPLRFGELRRWLPEASPKILTARLRELEGYGFIERRVLSVKPFAVEYRLTAKGDTLRGIIDGVTAWGVEHVFDTEERTALQAATTAYEAALADQAKGSD